MPEKMQSSFESEKFQQDRSTVYDLMDRHAEIINSLPFSSNEKREDFELLISKIIVQSSVTEALRNLDDDIRQKFYAPEFISADPMWNVGIIRNDRWEDTTVMSIKLLESFFDIRYQQWKQDEDIIHLRRVVARFMSAVYADYRLESVK